MNQSISYVCGTSSKPLIFETIGAAFDRVVRRWSDRPAVVVRHQGIRWTYQQFGEAVEAFAAGLLALDLEPGDRIGIWSPNNIEWYWSSPIVPGLEAPFIDENHATRQVSRGKHEHVGWCDPGRSPACSCEPRQQGQDENRRAEPAISERAARLCAQVRAPAH